ncbi:MAG TPA: NAD-dependent epimerase/dehydratase family protein [Tepidisphaeraceae bacterium]|jgi:CDP-paratose 2-epimerase|nr:NAD-dependent epimerase/dehydratase family protein [Tepidisphaeraceae bacterium]
MKKKHTSRSRGALAAPARHAGPAIGMLEWFRLGEHDRVDRVLSDLKTLGVSELRIGVSWADWHTPEGEAWYAWLFPQLARQVNVLPCFLYTPPSWGVAPKTSAPPRDTRCYADFIDLMIKRFGRHFEYVELWNEPNNLRAWDVALDPYWLKFSEMVGAAAYWAKQCGKKTVLGGMSPIDAGWLRLMGERNLLRYIDAVGVHAFPGSSEAKWEGWRPVIDPVRTVLDQFQPEAQVWITETGYSTWRHDERRQLTAFVDTIDAPVDRVYWYAAHDLDPMLPTVDGFHADEREYHYGLKRTDGGEKLLYRLWAEGGTDAVRDAYWIGRSAHVMGQDKPVLITGGCGFIGTNVAHRIMSSGQSVLLYDNLSRPGVEKNLRWLRQEHGDLMRIEAADVQDAHALRMAVARASKVFHFAAQVAVTTSLVNAIHDFEVNARGTLNLLEAIRAQDEPPPLVFTSTNKVYGGLPDVRLRLTNNRYEPVDAAVRDYGIGESRPLDFHSPYGCSKGTADQYVVDYARTFGLPAVVFRMSCMYGPHQFGNEDQGWVAHFLIKALKGEPITIYGDGKQVRDILFIDDLVDAFLLAQAHMNDERVRGHAFNIGGTPANTISLFDLLDMIEDVQGTRPDVRFGSWRPGDQRYYVSDARKLTRDTGWRPTVSAAEGVARLNDWLAANVAKPRRRAMSLVKPGQSAWSSIEAKQAADTVAPLTRPAKEDVK